MAVYKLTVFANSLEEAARRGANPELIPTGFGGFYPGLYRVEGGPEEGSDPGVDAYVAAHLAGKGQRELFEAAAVEAGRVIGAAQATSALTAAQVSAALKPLPFAVTPVAYEPPAEAWADELEDYQDEATTYHWNWED